MTKLSLNVDELRVESFQTVREDGEGSAAAVITGKACITRPTVYGTCCTP